MKKTLVISGHPNLNSSNTNKVILQELEKHRNELNLEIRQLDQLYPDYNIKIEDEQKALLEADTIVLQFPFYWYSIPALLKKWIDDVFAYGFAYGSSGDKLKGKNLILSFTVGGPKESYQQEGYNHYHIEELLFPLNQTANLCGLKQHNPVYTNGMVYIPDVYNTLEGVIEKAQQHSSRLLDAIKLTLS